MLLDCTTCTGRGVACGGCFVAAMLDPRPGMDADVVTAIDVLQGCGLIGPLHLALVGTAGSATPADAPTRDPLRVVRRAG